MTFVSRSLCMIVVVCSAACAVDHHVDGPPETDGPLEGTQDPAGDPGSDTQATGKPAQSEVPPDVDPGETPDAACEVTPDCSEETASAICATSEDCEVCVQYVDEAGNPVVWAALHPASQCECPPATEYPVAWCQATFDCGSEEIARVICDTVEDCAVCVQAVDEAGDAVLWAAVENASLCGGCPDVYVISEH